MEQSPRTIKFQLDHRNITTAFELPGYRIEQSLGVVLGITVRSTNMVGSIKAGLKTVVGGNIGTWTDMCNQARQDAFDQMVQHAAALGANAVIGMRYDANDISSMATEVLAYGT
ncbi:MAG TPA: YbjQ family protein, partial [Herpetosiphonaceae bacterium]